MPVKVKRGGKPDLLILLAAVGNVHAEWRLQERGPKDVVITAGSNGTHLPTSKHYSYQAIDVRASNFAVVDKLPFLGAVIGRLGDPVSKQFTTGPGFATQDGQWVGIYEKAGTPEEHFHLERN